MDEFIAELIKKVQPKVVVNMALPYQDLPIMDACLETKTDYVDTANYEPKDVAKFEYSWQWAYQDRFKDKGLMALLGCGFDPGATQAYYQRDPAAGTVRLVARPAVLTDLPLIRAAAASVL